MEDMLQHVEPSTGDDWIQSTEELEGPLRAIYWSLYECGGGMVADGRLIDLIRRVSCFGERRSREAGMGCSRGVTVCV